MLIEVEEIRKVIPNLPDLLQVNLLRGVHRSLRGFHFSELDENHWKLLTVVQGSVRDAYLDVRTDSPTYGVVGYLDISSSETYTLVIPPGFAHAVQTTSQESVSIYATNVPYSRNAESEISPLSGDLEKLWILPPIQSDRDTKAPVFDKRVSIISSKFDDQESQL